MAMDIRNDREEEMQEKKDNQRLEKDVAIR